MSTPHNSAKLGDIAKVVLMLGDPLRAKHIAETYLDNVQQFNSVRNMFGYTGIYKGRKISVMGSGMGMPSMGIYSYELYKFYEVESIIRIGSCGAIHGNLDLYTTILADRVYTDSTYGKVQSGYQGQWQEPNKVLNKNIKNIANSLNIELKEGAVASADVFYSEIADQLMQNYLTHNILAVEMEAFALFHNATILGKKAAALLTVSDNIIIQKETTVDERQRAFSDMMLIALELAAEEGV